MKNIAIYGKGGIGKSTIACHLAAAWGLKGLKVALIGCDPKKDTCMLLTRNNPPKPLLEALMHGESIERCIVRGYANVLCMEIGGPEPGVGCAGRGLLLAFEHLDRLGVLEGLDVIVYDVPGDVVCGGFAVPMKRTGSEVYIVTSGEYLSLYAANGISKAVRRMRAKLGGIILNSKGSMSEEIKVVETFAAALNSKIIGVIPRLPILKKCSLEGKTIFQVRPKSRGSMIFKELAEKIIANAPREDVNELSDVELLSLVRKTQAV
ncbi:MAG: AAA family ATPase [Candidatus Nezhaarchaeota archaeon]|nr:AAA family ATPase [Candidatus Nezhaarchaeota archaeon]